MLKFLSILALLASPALADPRPDIGVPATISGVSFGSLDTTGNIVANVDRILSILNQFHTIVESLYYVETPEYSLAAENFRSVMDSLVEGGSPIFQGLSNFAKVSSGDAKRAIGAIQSDIQYSAGSNQEHLQLLNQTRLVLGDKTADYFRTVLNQLTTNLGNISAVLNNIQEAVLRIQALDTKTDAAIKALVPTNDIRALNAVLRQYILIGDAAVPEIRSVVTRMRSVDSFRSRLQSVVNQQRLYLNSTVERISSYVQANVVGRVKNSLTAVRDQLITRSSKAVAGLSGLQIYSLSDLWAAANETAPVLSSFVTRVSSGVNVLIGQVSRLAVDGERSFAALKFIEDGLLNSTRTIALAMTQRYPKADTCFAQNNYEFDKIPRAVYTQLYNCLWDTTNDLTSAAVDFNYVLQLAVIDMNYGLLGVERCLSLLYRNAPDLVQVQAAACLREVTAFLAGRRVYEQQLSSFQQLATKEPLYSSQRYEFCLRSPQGQGIAQINYLQVSINRCLNITAPTIVPFKFRGKVTIHFG
ncbi:uncharacterized protein LOC129770984 [Toxorhynchites rutilus septentrionalis]|uniref:uncharacterized protein LOC129770984 n=1 Tax=Toxorhynchites rutilus septentrionalis TaxID=329112 RepID=UPI002478F4EA|nr:uncharacterized protein LOC129770984 [Toxorhynchites rutilus septentrionalis]